MTNSANPMVTPYPEVDAVLELLLSGIRSVLGDQLVGLYIHGSLASGDFEPSRSDIDFVAATPAELPQAILPELRGMHARLSASGLHWARELEGSYLPLSALRRYDPLHNIHPALRVDGSFELDGHGSDWIIQLSLLRERAIVLAGPDPRDLINPVEPDDLRRAVRGILGEWWSQPLPQPERFASRHYQSYAVLTMCRALFTLHFGRAPSKTEASRWALETLEAGRAGLIQRALAWPREPQPDELQATLDFVDYTTRRGLIETP